MKAPGWFVRERAVVILCLFAVCAVLLAIGSGFAWLAAGRAERRADRARQMYVTLADTARVLVDSMRAVQCIATNPGDAVRVFPAPRPDTLKRAGR